MASREPIPRYFFSLMPSEKKYSPGASVVAARREPIITGTRYHQKQHISSSGGKIPQGRCAQHWLQPPCPQPPAGKHPHAQCDAIWKHFLGDFLQWCSPVEAPSARALAMCPTVWIPPSAITGTPNLLAYSDTLYTAVAWGRPHASTVGQSAHRVSSTQQHIPVPAGPFRLPAHTCSRHSEHSNPWMLLP